MLTWFKNLLWEKIVNCFYKILNFTIMMYVILYLFCSLSWLIRLYFKNVFILNSLMLGLPLSNCLSFTIDFWPVPFSCQGYSQTYFCCCCYCLFFSFFLWQGLVWCFEWEDENFPSKFGNLVFSCLWCLGRLVKPHWVSYTTEIWVWDLIAFSTSCVPLFACFYLLHKLWSLCFLSLLPCMVLALILPYHDGLVFLEI